MFVYIIAIRTAPAVSMCFGCVLGAQEGPGVVVVVLVVGRFDNTRPRDNTTISVYKTATQAGVQLSVFFRTSE